MLQLVLFSSVLLLMAAAAACLSKKKAVTEKSKNALFIISAILTVLAHYSSIVYHLIESGSAMDCLRANPNYLLPIYPCNVVMWCCLLYACLKNKEGFFAKMLADYIFWFGGIACLVGMFANVDFIRNPGFRDYDAVRSVFAHGFMSYNILLFAVFGRVKIDLPRNMRSILLSVFGMLFIGLYCNLLFAVLSSREAAYDVNAMFLLHSPVEGAPFLTYPLLAGSALVFYFAVFSVCELCAYPKGFRWLSRLRENDKTG